MFVDLGRSIDIAGQYTDNFVGIIQQLGEVGAGNLPRLARWFGELTLDFDAWLAEKGPTGLQAFVDTGITALQDLGGVLHGTGRILAGLADAAEAAGGTSLGLLDDKLDSIADTIERPAFQRGLTDVFEAAHTAMDALTNGAGADFQRFLLELGDTLEVVLPTAGRSAGTALSAIFDALSGARVQTALIKAFEDIERSIDTLAPPMPALAQALAVVADVMGDVGVNLARGLAPALETLGPVLDDLAADLEPLVDSLGNLLVSAVETASPVVVELGDVLGDLATALDALVQPVTLAVDLLAKVPAPLIAAGAVVAATTWIGVAVRAKVAAFGIAMTSAGRQATVAQAAFFRAGAAAQAVTTRMTAARLGIGGAGIALATLGTNAAGSNKALSALASAGGGALMGFAVGGPIGAAIGGGAGALIGLMTSTDGATQALEDAVAPAKDYASSLDQITGAATRSTRALALKDLQERDAIQNAASFGISQRDMIDAMLGIKPAVDRVNEVLEKYNHLRDYDFPDDPDVKDLTPDAQAAQRYIDLEKAMQDVGFALEGQAAGVRRNAAALESLDKLLINLPKKAITQVELLGSDLTFRRVRELAKQYRLTPREIRTLVELTGERESSEQVDRLIRRVKTLGKTKGSAEVGVNTKSADKAVDDVTGKVKNVDKLEGAAAVRIKDEATVPIGKVEKLLTSYERIVVKATLDVTDNATAKINAVRANLARLNNQKATVITEHVTRYSSSGRRGGGQSGSTPLGRVASDQGRAAGLEFSRNFGNAITQYLNRSSNLFDQLIRTVGKKGAKGIRKQFSDDLAQLDALAKRHEKLMRQYEKAVDRVADVRAKLNALQDSVRATIVDTANPVNAEVQTYDGIVTAMQDAKAKAKEFLSTIKQLVKSGLNKTTLQQILAAGPDAGLATAQAILDGGVAQINQIQAQITSAANGVANAAGSHIFGGLLENAEADVDKLLDKLKPLQARLRDFAKDLIDALRDQLDKEFKKAKKDGDSKSVTPPKRATSNRMATDASAGYTSQTINVNVNYTAVGEGPTAEEKLFSLAQRGRMLAAAA